MSETIREYLVALGFGINENSLKRFIASADTAGKAAVGLGAAAALAGFEVMRSVEKIAQNFMDLYFIAQRSQTTVTTLKNMGDAAKFAGIRADDMVGTLAHISEIVQRNPGTQAWIEKIVGHTIDGKEPKEWLDDLIVALQKYPTWYRAQVAEALGISYEFLRNYENNRDRLKAADKDVAAARERAGVAPNDTGWRAFYDALATLQNHLGVLWERLAQDWVGPATKILNIMTPLVDKVLEWNKAHDGMGSTILPIVVAGLGGYVIKLGLMMTGFKTLASYVPTLGGVFSKFAQVLRSTFGMLGRIGGFLAPGSWMMRLLGGPLVAGAQVALTPSETNAGEDEHLRQGNIHAGLPPTGPNPTGATAGMPAWMRGVIESTQTHLGRIFGQLLPSPNAPGNPAGGMEGAAASYKDRAKQIMQFLTGKGLSAAQAAGILGNLDVESNLDPNKVNPNDKGKPAYGLAQWRGDREGAGHGTLQEQLMNMWQELQTKEKGALDALMQTKTAREAAAVFDKMFERSSGTTVTERQRRAAEFEKMGNSFGFTTNISISGIAKGAEDIAKKVTDSMRSVSSDLVRQVEGVMR